MLALFFGTGEATPVSAANGNDSDSVLVLRQTALETDTLYQSFTPWTRGDTVQHHVTQIQFHVDILLYIT